MDNSFRNLVESIQRIDEGKKSKTNHLKGKQGVGKSKPIAGTPDTTNVTKGKQVGESDTDYGFLSDFIAEDELEEDLITQMKREMNDYMKSRKEVDEEGSKPKPFNHTKPLGGKDIMAKKGVKTIRSKEDGPLSEDDQLNEFWGELAGVVGGAGAMMYTAMAIIDWLVNKDWPGESGENITPRAIARKFKKWRHDTNFKKAFATLKDDPELMDFLNDDSNFKKSSHYLMPGKQKIFFNMVRSKMEALGFDHTPEREMNDAKRDYRRHKVAQDRHEKYGEPMESEGVTKGYMDHMAKVNKGEKNKYPSRGKGKPIDKDKFFGKKKSLNIDTGVNKLDDTMATGTTARGTWTIFFTNGQTLSDAGIQTMDSAQEWIRHVSGKYGLEPKHIYWEDIDTGEIKKIEGPQLEKFMNLRFKKVEEASRDQLFKKAMEPVNTKRALQMKTYAISNSETGKVRKIKADNEMSALAKFMGVRDDNFAQAYRNFHNDDRYSIEVVEGIEEARPMPTARDEIGSQMADMHDTTDIDDPLGGEGPYAITTYYQYHENYGSPEEPYWKAKGGGTAVHAKNIQSYAEAQKVLDQVIANDPGFSNPMANEDHTEPEIVPMKELDFDKWYTHDYS